MDKNEKLLSVITYYSDNDKSESKDIYIDFQKEVKYEVVLLDDVNNSESLGIKEDLTFSFKGNSCILIREI